MPKGDISYHASRIHGIEKVAQFFIDFWRMFLLSNNFTKGITSPLGDNIHSWGTTSHLGDNFAPGG
jgi:hypothetical protein